MINAQSYQITGMRQDNLVGTGTSSKFAHEIKNMRFNTIGDYTSASWTTEKGTKEVTISAMPKPGTVESYEWLTSAEIEAFRPIGQAVIKDEWVLFGIIENNSVILNLHYGRGDSLLGRVLYSGELGFNEFHPIETLTFYENEKLQKVYWTDGYNQPRVINIKGADDKTDGFDSNLTTQFDFIQEVSLDEKVTIVKDQSGAGLFPPCTVKYALSYYHKYGQETNVVYDSPLYYPTIGERACSPDELSGDSFYITIENLDTTHGFDYIRLYSIVKTVDNATPIVKIVEDKPIKGVENNTVTFHDTNTTGEVIDPSIIQFIGGQEIIAHTFDQKNNTLFLGNITLKTKSVTDVLKDVMPDINGNASKDKFVFENGIREDLGIRKEYNDFSVYQWVNQLNPSKIYNHGSGHYITKSANSQYVKHFKFRETYRFGIQFQDNKGAWSEVIYLNDITNDVTPYTDEWNTECKFAGVKYALPQSARNVLINNNYKKARLVCCYPTNADRHILAQGVVAPTVYNNSWRESHTPDVMSSWFFRPNDKYVNNEETFEVRVLPWQDEQPLDKVYYSYTEDANTAKAKRVFKTVPEIQSTYHYNEDTEVSDWEDDKSVYKVSRKVLTFHSPEIELDETLRTLPSDSWEVYVVGKVPINSYAAKYYIDAGLPALTYYNDRGNGLDYDFESQYVRYSTTSEESFVGTHLTALGEWNDANLYTNEYTDDQPKFKDIVPYCIYPFHRKTSLNNYIRDIDDWKVFNDKKYPIKESAKLNNKCLSHILYSTTALYTDSEESILNKDDNATFNIFDSNEVLPLKIKTNDEDFIYYGNVNSISPISDEHYKKMFLKGYSADNNIPITGAYPLAYYKDRLYGEIKYSISGVKNVSNELEGVYTSDPVPITYKSTPHGVFFTDRLDYINDTRIERSKPDNPGNPGEQFNPTFTEVNDSLTRMPFLYLAEIRKRVNPDTIFGGKPSVDHPVHNIYVPCGPAINLDDTSHINNNNLMLYGLEGDTYYMRYDNLKTYPYSTEDTNQIVEILSFMVETRINLDGRYDKNRGLLDNTIVNNTNFGLINKSYTQQNNTFNFLTLDELGVKLNEFDNQFTWTKQKVSGETTDAWTNITLASTADADGTLGNITKILNLNDNLLMFQEHGLAQILYDESTAISTENGVPLELSKTGKFTGLKYISREIGCQNKWSISLTKNRLLWIDDSRQEIMSYGENIQSLSTLNGFDAFMIKQLPETFKPWNPYDFDNFVTYYDKLSNDIYYINKDYCLAWNEQTGTFTSFYSYENIPYMINLGQHSLMWNKGVWAARELTESVNGIEKEVYSKFFDNIEDYWMTIVCDGQTDKGNAFSADKVFNNIEYRADIYNIDGTNAKYSTSVFNKKHVWNGYQDSGECPLEGIRKFNTWRVQLPRNAGTRDRIRNPFCYIKLKQDNTYSEVKQTDRMILHDLAVYFDMR